VQYNILIYNAITARLATKKTNIYNLEDEAKHLHKEKDLTSLKTPVLFDSWGFKTPKYLFILVYSSLIVKTTFAITDDLLGF